jgi:hypothetical protein
LHDKVCNWCLTVSFEHELCYCGRIFLHAGLPAVPVYSEAPSVNHCTCIFAVLLVLEVAVCWFTQLCMGEVSELDLYTQTSNFNWGLSWLSLDTPSIQRSYSAI